MAAAPEVVEVDMVVHEVGEDMAEEVSVQAVVMAEAEAVEEVELESSLRPFSPDTTLNTVASPLQAVFPSQPSMSAPTPCP